MECPSLLSLYLYKTFRIEIQMTQKDMEERALPHQRPLSPRLIGSDH